LLIGEGVPEGKTVYVLKRDIGTNEVELWNASEGTVFSLRQETFGSKFLCCSVASGTRSMMNALDQVISLRSVGCLIDENDVYLNIQ